ncbi:MAG: O-antigen ligase [Pseudomonadota bacterium]
MPGLPSVSAPSPAAKSAETPVSPAEFTLLIAILLVFSEGILPRLLSNDATSDGSPILRYLWLPIYAVTAAGIIWKIRDIMRVCLRLPFLMALLGVCALSFVWSIEPSLSMRRGIAIVMTTAAGLFLGTRYSWKTMLRALALVWIIICVTSFLSALLVPSFGRMQEIHVGAWQGFYFEKNQLGGHMARAAVFGAFLMIMDRPYRWAWATLLAMSVLLVLLSTSKSSLLGLILGLGVIAAGVLMKRGIRTGLVTLWLGVIGAALFAVVMIFAPSVVFELLGRDATLTGRTDIWYVLADYIGQRPLLGYGYGAFWSEFSEPGNWVRETLQWDAPTAHNGWLEVAVALGFVGLGFLMFDFFATVTRAVLASVNTWTGLFALAFIAQFFLFSLSESASLQQNSIVWLVYVALAAKLTMRPKGLVQVTPVRAVSPVSAPA